MKSRLSEKVEVRESGIDRKGMFAKEHIFKGEIVYIKGGHIIRKNEIFTSGMINSYLPISDDYYIIIHVIPIAGCMEKLLLWRFGILILMKN